METAATASANPYTQNITSSSRYRYDASLQNSTSLRLKTHEGDIVTLTRNQSLAYFESSEQSQSDNNEDVQSISASGQAAAEYAMSLEGDLNDEEKKAIDELTKKLDPIAQNFFDNVTENPDELDQALQSSLGTLDEIEVNFEQTTTVKYSAEEYRQASGDNEQTEVPDSQNAENSEQAVYASAPQAENGGSMTAEDSSIRDVASMLRAVIDAVLRPREDKIPPKDDRILQSFDDLRKLLNSKLREFFSPLSQKAELPPEQVGKPAKSGDVSAPTQTAPEPQSRFQPVTI